MEKNFELRQQIEQVDNPEVLKSALFALLEKIDSLEQRLGAVGENSEGKENIATIVVEKRERLERIRHGLTEMNERMERPYVVSAELQAVKEVLDILAESGDCNSVILEGEPGTGKTQWAYSEVGQELQEGNDVALVHVRVKDTMRAQDLLYSIDDVRRLSDAQAQAQVPEEIRNEATLWKQKIIGGEINPATDEGYKAFKAKMEAVVELGETSKDLDYLNYVDLGPLGEAIHQSGKGKKVYLVIDEIEKGREELMTGILDEIENLTFTIGETGTIIKGDKKNLRIVITTNTEDSDKIPPSFRRRSLYHYVDYPSRSDLAQIVELNFPGIQKELLNYAVSVFYQYHENSEVQKKPSTPELLSWVRVLTKEYDGGIPEGVPHREILLKYQEDQALDIGKINVEAQEQVEKREGELPHFAHKALQGEKVFHLDSRLNSFHDQNNFSEFYAHLQNEGINFVTPYFEEREERDNYGDWNTVQKCTRNFQIIIPGVESLGDGYYVIPEDKMALVEKVIDTKTEVLPAGQKFTSVTERSKNLTRGRIEVDGYEYDAYMVEDGRIVINKPYK
jgi:MoxR-like ATPase